jgi:hypothetical protein
VLGFNLIMAALAGQVTRPSDQVDDLDDLLRDYKADTLALSDKERRILELYDQVQQNDLERQILQAEASGELPGRTLSS